MNSNEVITGIPLWQKVALMLTMMSIMGGTLTGVMTYINLGYSEGFYQSWLTSFVLATVILMPVGYVLMDKVEACFCKLLPNLDYKPRSLLVGLVMALIMESLMAIVTTINNVGFSTDASFVDSWFAALLAALPVGIGMMLVMSMTIKPKVDRLLKS